MYSLRSDTVLLLNLHSKRVFISPLVMPQVQDAACPLQEGASSKFAVIQDMEGEHNWNGENAEESLSHQDGSETRKTLRKHLGNWFRSRRGLTVLLVLSVLLILALVMAVAVLAGEEGAAASAQRQLWAQGWAPCSLWRGILRRSPFPSSERLGEIPVTPGAPEFLACPEAWIGYNRVCYYLSRDEGTWEQARDRCSELRASLAVLSDKEMGFLFRLNGNLDYWLGLRRWGERLQWVDGSSYNSS
ncbi:C-type lectin domain family 4 member G-like [Pseudopipra pipra]|uniref:C-type lectin domain family 4 member G-like n=1 Tax=Pseudopipra pipra TaxID=415032 RepID=UPI0031399859